MFSAATSGVNAAAFERLEYYRFALGASAQIAKPIGPLGEGDNGEGGVRAIGLAQNRLRYLLLLGESFGASRAKCVEPRVGVATDAVVPVAGIARVPQSNALGDG